MVSLYVPLWYLLCTTWAYGFFLTNQTAITALQPMTVKGSLITGNLVVTGNCNCPKLAHYNIWGNVFARRLYYHDDTMGRVANVYNSASLIRTFDVPNARPNGVFLIIGDAASQWFGFQVVWKGDVLTPGPEWRCYTQTTPPNSGDASVLGMSAYDDSTWYPASAVTAVGYSWLNPMWGLHSSDMYCRWRLP
eukprot:TRINITY_DN1914_c0_g1_i1.p1 TRINITY_DN1914_c0_g1~~TRINITY_DN1914_c0_g1_i1.p1  ORF type:complete len:192 (-),score=1.98 TRINITY_DN1914_c0_g1_i1:150-725(-)